MSVAMACMGAKYSNGATHGGAVIHLQSSAVHVRDPRSGSDTPRLFCEVRDGHTCRCSRTEAEACELRNGGYVCMCPGQFHMSELLVRSDIGSVMPAIV